MTVFRQSRDSIEGHRIIFSAGEALPPNIVGSRTRGNLGRNVIAEVVKPLRKGSGKPTSESDRIECFSAKYEADYVEIKERKEHAGSHRNFVGYLEGEAKCSIQVPSKNIAPS